MSNTTAIVLPYQKRLNHVHYLIHRELVPAWDEASDLCGIMVQGTEATFDRDIAQYLLETYDVKITSNDLKMLGICATDRHSDHFCYLYAVDLTGRKDLEHIPNEPTPQLPEDLSRQLFWVEEDILLESLDSQLITCFAKLKHLLL